MIEVPDARAAAPRLSRMRLHHARAQPASAGARRRDRRRSYASRDRDKAAAYCREFGGAASYGDYLAAIADPRDRRGGRRRAAAVPSRPDAAGARRRQARAGREAGVPADWRTTGRSLAARDAAGRGRPGRRERSLQAARGPAAAAARRRRHRRDGVRALRDDRAAAEDAPTTGATTRRWPAATRSSRKGFTGCTSPAASARGSSRSTATGRRCRAKGPTGAPRA